VIAEHSDPGDLVLDPFCGSGVAPIEAAILGRRAVGVDLNPFAVFLASRTAAACDPDMVEAAAGRVIAAARQREQAWHTTRCRLCGQEASLAATARSGDVVTAVVVRCHHCRQARRETPSREDLVLERSAQRAGDGDAPRPPVPAGWQTRKLARAGISDFGGLFTQRNLRALAAIRTAIMAEQAGVVRDLLLLALTGALAQASRMMADHSTAGGGASWKINIYWLPERSLELDPFRCFENRVARILAAKRETQHVIADPPRIVLGDARTLERVVQPGSVRYVFADPPYGGEGIQYAELSALWCGWLDPPLAAPLADEIGENPTHGRDAAAYASALRDAFLSVRRVLADDGEMTVTFASSRPASWRALREALDAARFTVTDEQSLSRSAPAITQHTTRRATRHDVWLSCRPSRAGQAEASAQSP
jgi:adenine-specific DNA methylase